MYSTFPRISICFNHFRLSSNTFVILFNCSVAYFLLPITTILNSIRRIKVDALHLPLHALTIQQGIHHQQTITLNQSVLPVVAMLVVTSQSFQFILLLFLKISKQVEL